MRTNQVYDAEFFIVTEVGGPWYIYTNVSLL